MQLSHIYLGAPRLLDLIIEFFIPVTTHLVIVYEFPPAATHLQLPVTTSVLKRILPNATTLIIEIDHLILDEPHTDSNETDACKFEPSIQDPISINVSLAKGITTHMPNIENHFLGEQTHRSRIHLQDSELELLLSAHTKTYKKILCSMTANPGPLFVKAMKRHYPTLEEFCVAKLGGNDSYLMDILINSPKLRTLMWLREGDYPVITFPKISAKSFAD
ncbi:hypothetical protein MVEG_08446 [Podila verticillata NRRL 6337]|nr:hypothetical protein MVEG_08446 [Podila verticillata NRRL 6337]